MIYTKIQIKNCEWFYISDGTHIIYFEPIKYSNYYRVSSVHKPNRVVGTGYGLSEGGELNQKTVETFLKVLAPNWAHKDDFKNIVKYKNLDEWLKYEEQFFDDIHMSKIELR
jgi:hypothetical protein